MKQQQQAIQRIKNIASDTITNIKTELINQSLKEGGSVFSAMFNQYIDSLQTIIFNLLNDMGNEYQRITNNITLIGSVALKLKGENNELNSKLNSVHQLIEQKQLKIEALQNSNNNLKLQIVALQNIIAKLAQDNEGQSVDSVQNIESENMNLYESEASSSGSDIQQLCNLDDAK